MKINKISIPQLRKDIEINNINAASASSILSVADTTNQLIAEIEVEGTLIKTQSREGDLRVKQNPLLFVYFQSVSTLNKLLKDNGLIIPIKKTITKEEKAESKIETILNNLNNLKSKASK